MYLSYTHQPPPTWPPDCCSEPSTVCKHTECVPQVRFYTDDPFRPASRPISVSSHRQMGLCWQGSIVRGQRSWQRGDDVTAGCGPSNRQCSVGKIAVSARGHPAGHREGFDELISARWLPLIQLGLPGWRIERKKPWGFEECHKAEWRIRWRDRNAIKNPRWGVVIILLVAVKKRPPVTQTQWIRPGAKCTVQTAGSQHFVSFFHRLWLLRRPDVLASLHGFETARPGCRMGSRSLLSIHTTT